MPTIPKIFTGKLDLDTSAHLVAKTDFIDALNISRDQGTAVRNDDAVAGNVKGNRFVPYNLPAVGTNKTIGSKPDPLRNCVYAFIFNSEGYNAIVRYNNATRTIDKVFESKTYSSGVDILGWNVDYKINHIDIIHRDEGDLLFWTDALNPPMVINVTTALAGGYIPATQLDILVAKAPPALPPTAAYISDGNVTVNNLKGHLFEFDYRYLYPDFEKSTFTALSASPLPPNDYQSNINPLSGNVINVTVNSGGSRVKKVEIVFRQNIQNSWSDYFSMVVLDKELLSIPDNTDYTFQFTNNGAYSAIDANEAIQLFDYVPQKANAQCLANGNTLVYGGITEGYNKLANLNVTTVVTYDTVPLPSGDIIIGNPGFDFTLVYGITGTPLPPQVFKVNFTIGATVTPGDQYNLSFKINNTPFAPHPTCPPIVTPTTYNFSYTAMLGDTPAIVAAYFVSQIDPLSEIVAIDDGGGLFHMLVNGAGAQCYYFTNITAQALPATATAGGNFFDRIYKFGGKFRFGIVYKDAQGVTPGVETYFTTIGNPDDFEVDIDQFNAFDTAYKRPVIELTVKHLPPTWAKTFSFVRSLNLITQSFFMWKCDDFQDDGSYFYFGIDNLETYEAATPNFSSDWTFQTGDRLKACYEFNGANDTGWGAIYSPVLDYEIVGVVEYDPGSGAKTYIKVQKYPGTINPGAYTSNTVFEVYRPALRTDGSLQVYYEFGESYPCVEIDGINYHEGQTATTNPTFEFRDGDIYLRIRQGLGDNYLIQDPNFSDFLVSAVNSNGRAFIVDENAAQTYNPVLVRFSQSYQFGTNINGLNRFYFDNFDEYNRDYGPILKLDTYASYMKVGQSFRIGNVPILLSIVKDATGSDNLTVSDRLLNQIVYYQGDVGIGTCPESWARNNFVVYGCDNIRGVVWRLSQDGLTLLSILYNINSWAISELKLRTGSSHIYGVYNAAVNRYEIALEEADPVNSLAVQEQTTFNYSGTFQVSTAIEDICAAPFVTLYSGEPFGVGTKMFTSDSLVFPVTENSYIADSNGDIYNLNSATGVVGSQTAFACGTGIAGSYLLDTVEADICDNDSVVLYSDIAFAPGAFLYYDSSLITPVTGFNFVSSGGVIYNLNSTTGEVGAATGGVCGGGTSGAYILGNDSGTICAGSPQILYTDGPFMTGGILYTDVNLTTPVTGFLFVVNAADDTIYNLNNTTGEIGATTGVTCGGGYITENYDATTDPLDASQVCISPVGLILFSSVPFNTGVTLYIDAGLTTPVTGYFFIKVGSDVTIHQINNTTGIVGTAVGVCP